MDDTFQIAIEDLVEIETLIAVHGTTRQLDSTGHMCFAIAAAISSYHA